MANNELTTERLHELLAICERATPGEWRSVALLTDGENHHVLAGEFSDQHIRATADDPNGLVAFADIPANTDHIAAFYPDRCAALVREVIESREELGRQLRPHKLSP